MKTPVRSFLLSAMFALCLTPTAWVVAQETPAAAEVESTQNTQPGGMRRLDVVDEDVAAPAALEAPEPPEAAAAPAPDDSTAAENSDNSRFGRSSRHRGGHGSERVAFGHGATLRAGESANAVVSIFGSSTSDGDVREAVVSILGNSTSSGDVGEAVVSVLGNSRVTGGTVGDAVVSVLGTTYVDGEVYGEVVAVLGNIVLGPNAIVHGQLTCVGGTVKRDPAAEVHGQVNNVAFGWGVEDGFGGMEWLQAWVNQCLFFLRPLAFGENLMWAWWIALAFLGLYAFLALVAARPVETCLQTLERRPGYSILASLLTVLLSPVVITLLCVTVVGIALVPFLGAALFFGTIFGKAVILAFIGRLITKHASGGLRHPAIAVLIGGVIVLLLYTVPVLGFIIYKTIGVLGLGVVIYTLMLSNQRKAAPAAATAATAMAMPASPAQAVAETGVAGVPFVAATPGEIAGAAPAVEPVAATPPPPIAPTPVSALTLVRAGFWIRIAASAIDALLVLVAIKVLPNFMQPNFLLVFAVYCIALWALKGTTVGGIVCNLKVVRVDDRPLDWPTALVRALGGFLSLVAAGVGFAWVAFDDQRQSWHDKIAGTTIVHVPKGVSLV